MSVQRPNSAVLCSQCTNLLPLLVDISPKSKPGTAHTEWWDATYGKVRSIQGLVPDSCEMCFVLQKAFGPISGFNFTDTKINVSNRMFATSKGLQHSGCEFEANGTRLGLAPALSVVKTADGEDMHAFTGRFVLSVLNPLLIRNWLDRCGNHAGCQADHSSKDLKFAFRLIDVQNGCLVDAPTDARYVALSYVWGGVKQVMLNRTTRAFLEQEGSIGVGGLKYPEDEFTHLRTELEGRVIPRTIRDAIALCQHLNERYLWTDSLCILQDDDFQQSNGAWTNDDKLAQIPKMDIIYGASLLTVIAACGIDSNAGLPGVYPSTTRTKQVIGRIGDQIFVSVAEDPMGDFWRSKWAERAWTFQEFLLSKRHLIFLPEQVVYHCSTLSWSEDHCLEFVDEPENTMNVPAWTRSYKLRPLQLPNTSKWSDEVFFPALFINDYLNSWLKNFLKRQLTVTSDILFAFDGALSASTRHIGKFHHGLPQDYFCESLHWLVGTDSMYMGGGKKPHQGLTQRRKGFPSWSWTGWIWGRSGIRRVPYQLPRKNFGILVPNVEGWKRLDHFPIAAFQVDDNFTNCDLPRIQKSSITPDCIVIKTITAHLYLSSHRQSEWSAALQTYSSLDFVPENLIGGIYFPHKWQDKIGQTLQVIITGSYYYGPSYRSPNQTDEMDPMIDMLVVEQFEDGTMERLAPFVTRFSYVKKLEWTPVVAILR